MGILQPTSHCPAAEGLHRISAPPAWPGPAAAPLPPPAAGYSRRACGAELCCGYGLVATEAFRLPQHRIGHGATGRHQVVIGPIEDHDGADVLHRGAGLFGSTGWGRSVSAEIARVSIASGVSPCRWASRPATTAKSPGSAPRSPSPAPACRPQGDQGDGVGRCGLSSRTT